ncbi:molybdopterin-dependent oxidoreductase [Sulfurihydrogenibium subterraneum]|uniref:molybdopterin-dependent oxidoreductase n=1 Tax=Sulfurihydrogenibium subterraneum TaxID=171121 RepID=UPI00048E5621|nr:molybdopterin-dependent oxidoreductase [Sulfurihydrogenibium subterraneum]
MKRRNFLKIISLSLIFPNLSFAGLLDYFKKSKQELPPEGKYTPEDKLFIVDIKGVPSQVKNLDLKEYRLKVYGKVKNSVSLSLDEIKSLKSVERDVVLECVSNVRGDKIGRIKVKGVLLEDILHIVNPDKTAKEVVFRSFDGYHTSIELDYLKNYHPLIVYGINKDEDGKVIKDLSLDHGYPLRVICPEKWGYKSAKWLKEIEVVDHDYKGYWEKSGWSDRALRRVDYFDVK